MARNGPSLAIADRPHPHLGPSGKPFAHRIFPRPAAGGTYGRSANGRVWRALRRPPKRSHPPGGHPGPRRTRSGRHLRIASTRPGFSHRRGSRAFRKGRSLGRTGDFRGNRRLLCPRRGRIHRNRPQLRGIFGRSARGEAGREKPPLAMGRKSFAAATSVFRPAQASAASGAWICGKTRDNCTSRGTNPRRQN